MWRHPPNALLRLLLKNQYKNTLFLYSSQLVKNYIGLIKSIHYYRRSNRRLGFKGLRKSLKSSRRWTETKATSRCWMVEMIGIGPTTSCMRSKCSPIELHPQWLDMREITGIEPVTSCLQSKRSPNWAISPTVMVDLAGFEPATFRLSSERSNQLSYKSEGKVGREKGSKQATYWWWAIEEILRKEVIQPHLLIRLPCYDLTPVTDNTLGVCLHCWLTRRLKVQPTSMVWRAVCTRPENVFTATCWYAITSDSDFMLSSCRKQSGLRLQLEFS